jgi:hypothetical protein
MLNLRVVNLLIMQVEAYRMGVYGKSLIAFDYELSSANALRFCRLALGDGV